MRSHQVVLTWVEEQLASGELPVGSRLPAERMLAERLAVSRTSVREAIRILEAMGVVRSAVGSGPEAGTMVTADPATALGSALRLHVATSHLPVQDIVATRVLLETWAAARARPGAPSLALAAALLQEMDELADHEDRRDIDAFLSLDARFHVALAEAAGNAVVSAMMGSLRAAIQDYAGRLTANLPQWSSTAARLRGEHAAILAAVNAGDGGTAAALVAEHIEGYYHDAGLGGFPSDDPGS
ncbi:FadR family transcriptional regulator [Paenarthrobacter sp. Z7-10]|uniref:FadR/GntR family transcriptional regulator n=1 Tax=Paenarthrobacter sp. Z7-10 TaxID=2787635 RepID=UPI0022A9C647|nr:FCD domain-containing protein [Paenarthrobacter sp. Z7-10]MCZ2401779.1 FadR family transcriptional regulator [Paenarthrobacter sp. Z7-10]